MAQSSESTRSCNVRTLLTCDRVCSIWDHYSRTRLKTFSDAGGSASQSSPPSPKSLLMVSCSAVVDTSFSHNGQYLACASLNTDWRYQKADSPLLCRCTFVRLVCLVSHLQVVEH